MRTILNPQNRQQYIDTILANNGLSSIQEDPLAAYCAISLTQTPTEVKEFVLRRQQILMDEVLTPVGIAAYDPSTAPYSPDINLTSLPQEVYLVDSGKIAGARFFVGRNLTASTGFGNELEKAITLNRVAVILCDVNIRISRMQPHRIIYLQYTNFEKQIAEFREVFKLLLQYEPGMGFDGDEPVLLGFHKETQEMCNLEKLVYERFPQLKYHYNGKTPALSLSATNPELFYETRG